MTRIDPQLATPTGDKPAEKTVGKAGTKDGDSRQAAFRSLMHQLGGHGKAEKLTGKDAQELPREPFKRDVPASRNRIAQKDGKTEDPTTESTSAPAATETGAAGEPILSLQHLLGGGATDPSVRAAPTLDLSALASGHAGEHDAPAGKPEKIVDTTAGRLGRSVGPVLPNTADLALTHGDADASSTSDATDPFSALSSLLNRAADNSAEPEPEPEPADAAPIKMSVVTRETHFEPVARLSPVQQITTVVGNELTAMAEPAKTEVGPQSTETSRHSSGPLKVLHLKLEPEDLGSVVLKMRLVDKSLELEVVASRQETADLLAKDKEALTRALRGSGYSADVVSISTSTSPDVGQTSADARSGANTSSGQPGAQAGSHRGSNDPAGSGGRPSDRPKPSEGVPHEEAGPGRSGGDLYL